MKEHKKHKDLYVERHTVTHHLLLLSLVYEIDKDNMSECIHKTQVEISNEMECAWKYTRNQRRGDSQYRRHIKRHLAE